MTRGSLTFKETDVRRAIKSAIKAGLHVVGFEITKAGNIMVHAGKPANDNTAEPESDDWDKAIGHEGR